MTEQAVLLKQDVYSALYGIHEKQVDIVFADPPYREGHEEKLLSVLKEMNYVSENTMIIIEALLDTDFSYAENYGFEVYRVKEYKTNKHVFLRRKNH
jgi:16S rRNA (guanine966-N2)-methyltransferase